MNTVLKLIFVLISIFSLNNGVLSNTIHNKNFKNTQINDRPSFDEYLKMRNDFVDHQYNMSFEAGVSLNDRELLANEIIMNLKRSEIEKGLKNPSEFAPSQHFFEVKDQIQQSKLFQIIKKMPKGGVLHAHATSLVEPDFLVNLTYRQFLWQCNDVISNEIVSFKFSRSQPIEDGFGCNWENVADQRQKIGQEKYDAYVRTLFTLVTENFRDDYKDINMIWIKFGSILDLSKSLIRYAPVWMDYYKEALRSYASDGAQYLEFRGEGIQFIYDLDGNYYSITEAVQLYVDVLEQFKSENPDFFGSKYIYCPFRLVPDEEIQLYIERILILDKEFPNFFAGYDFSGQEDMGRRLIDFVPFILQLPPHINSYHHAGETKWFGLADENLIDAVLLGTKRIGHGFALNKYPNLLKIIKEKNIAVEVNPMSNQVLTLIDDLRNHPAAQFFALDIPMVISSDNYPLWEAMPLSTDYYMTFLGIVSSHSDLRTLKKLVENSIRYSSLSEAEKNEVFSIWGPKWDEFIEDVINNRI